ncbi:MAG: NAD-dependent epimerase/dehydratase family protein [Bacteroidota bacterium]
MPEKIFVTGADGLLGSNLVRELLHRGYEVRAFIQQGRKVNTLDGLPIEKAGGNLLEKNSVKEAMAGCSLVIHAAASTSVWPARQEIIRKVNIDGTKNVAESALESGVKKMVYVGSASTFGYGTLENPGTESSAYTANKYGMDYMDSKYEAHRMVLDFVARGLDVSIVNPTFMIGAYDSGPSSGAMIIALYKGKIPGYTNGGRNYIYVKDAATGIANAVTMGRKGESYIIGNENLSYKDAFQKMAVALGVKPPSRRVPDWIMLTYGQFSSLFAKVRGKAPAVSYNLAKIGIDKHYFSAQKAVNELKLPQTPIEVAVKEAAEWFRQNNYL